MPRERAQIDLGGPLLREREGCRLTYRSLSSRLCEAVDRLTSVTEAAMPVFSDTEWSLICCVGWDAISSERVLHRSSPADIEPLAWRAIVIEAAARAAEVPGLARRLDALDPVARVAVWERVEAYGRVEGMC